MSTWFQWTAALLGLLMVAVVYMIAWWLTRIYDRLGHLVWHVDNAVHDTLHPVFTARQLRRAREHFVERHTSRLRLEAELYRSLEWRDRRNVDRQLQAPAALRDRAKPVFEALVESESAWKVYLFMVEANVAVSSRGESRSNVLEALGQLLEQTNGTAIKLAIGSNPLKRARVSELLDNWLASLVGAEVESAVPEIPDVAEQVFGEVSDAHRDRDRAIEESAREQSVAV